jgi:uncharacterized protein YndB with AHSA1/START domain
MGDRERGYAHRIDILADAGQVWRALTEVEQLTRWCSPRAEIHACPGGVFRASVDRVTELEARIDVFEPERRLRLMYLPSPALPPAETVLIVDFLLDRAPGATVVRLLGSGVPATREWDAQYRRLRTSWQQAITRLKVLVEKQSTTGAIP